MNCNYPKYAKGFGLIEVLVALVILAIGLLGMAGLQSYSIASSYNAHLRTQATALAQGMIDRMRANRTEAMNDNYAIAFEATPPTTTTDCTSTACTALQIRNLDLLEWKCALGAYAAETFCTSLVSQSTLPQGDGDIVTQNDGQIRVTVRWVDVANINNPGNNFNQVMLFTNL